MLGHCRIALGAIALAAPTAACALDLAAETTISGLPACTSDYTWRGISQRSEQPSVMGQVTITHGILFSEFALLGLDLGDDALGRSIGNKELDVRLGLASSAGSLAFSFGVQLYMFPGGRDIVEGTLDHAEKNFQELFLSATATLNDDFSLGTSLMWSPDFYYETGDVWTGEVQASWVLPTIGSAAPRLTTTLGHAMSDIPDVVSPGSGYTYFNAGLEITVEKLVFDIRYWGTTVDNDALYADRVVFSTAFILGGS